MCFISVLLLDCIHILSTFFMTVRVLHRDNYFGHVQCHVFNMHSRYNIDWHHLIDIFIFISLHLLLGEEKEAMPFSRNKF
jgi:hypothetical protein